MALSNPFKVVESNATHMAIRPLALTAPHQRPNTQNPTPNTRTQIGAHLAEEEMQKLAPHQHEQLEKLKDEAAKAAARAVGGEGAEGAEGNMGGRDPFPSKLG